MLSTGAHHVGYPVPLRVLPQPLSIVWRLGQINLVGDDGVRPLREPRTVLLQLEAQRLELLHGIWLAEVDDVDEADAAFDVPEERYSEAFVLVRVLCKQKTSFQS